MLVVICHPLLDDAQLLVFFLGPIHCCTEPYKLQASSSLVAHVCLFCIACPAGTYASGSNSCSNCEKGFYCPGGTFTNAGAPNRTACPADMTTLGIRSTSQRSCGRDVKPANVLLGQYCAATAPDPVTPADAVVAACTTRQQLGL